MTNSQAAIDPTLLAVLSIFGGALLTALAGLIGAAINRANEHRAWLRDKRLDAYIKAAALLFDIEKQEGDVMRAQQEAEDGATKTAAEMLELKERLERLEKEIRRLNAALLDLVVPVAILGPGEVEKLIRYMTNVPYSEIHMIDVIPLMRQALKIERKPWFRRRRILLRARPGAR